jgi:hypothetical protein
VKKKLFVIIAFLVCFVFLSCGFVDNSYDSQQKANEEARRTAALSRDTIPVPNVGYFQERRTISKWAVHWDKPDAACYVYLISYGQIIGYYVSNGKPASTGSLLTPEYSQVYRGDGGVVEQQLPDIDGTYGTNNPGIRFFTASGIAVEWAGAGASYIYSDVPLKLNVPLLGD